MDLMEMLNAALLGIVEGLTEFLPVSSTAHLLLAERALGFEDPTGTFTIVIQLGAILALLVLYFGKIFDTIVKLPTRAEARRFALSVILAFIPAAILGLLAGHIIQSVFLEGKLTPSSARIIAATLIVGGIGMILVERFRPKPVDAAADALPLWKSLAVGVFQALALVPGVSRSGATIVGALLLGVERRAAAEFSFFLSLPTMIAATGYTMWKARPGGSAPLAEQLDFSHLEAIGIGFVFAFIAAVVVVKSFLGIVGKYGFAPFAWYRIALGLAVVAYSFSLA